MGNGGATTLLGPQRGELRERLVDSGWEFDFFRAVWLLERHCQAKAPVGLGFWTAPGGCIYRSLKDLTNLHLFQWRSPHYPVTIFQ